MRWVFRVWLNEVGFPWLLGWLNEVGFPAASPSSKRTCGVCMVYGGVWCCRSGGGGMYVAFLQQP